MTSYSEAFQEMDENQDGQITQDEFIEVRNIIIIVLKTIIIVIKSILRIIITKMFICTSGVHDPKEVLDNPHT